MSPLNAKTFCGGSEDSPGFQSKHVFGSLTADFSRYYLLVEDLFQNLKSKDTGKAGVVQSVSCKLCGWETRMTANERHGVLQAVGFPILVHFQSCPQMVVKPFVSRSRRGN